MRTTTAFAAAFLATMPGVARAAEPPCLTQAEFASLAGYALPSIIGGTADRCAQALAPGDYLRASGKDLAARYATQKAKHWPAAKSAFFKFSSSGGAQADKMLRGMPDASLQGMLDAMMEGMISQQIPLERCKTIDRVVGLLAPLPPENTAELIALVVSFGAKTDADTKRAKVGNLSICEA